MTVKNGNEMVKVVFDLEGRRGCSVSKEKLWATPIEQERFFRLENSPFYAFGVSYLDIIFAKPIGNGEYQFLGVEKHAGHSTYRLWIESGINNNEEFDFFWAKLSFLGCTYEGINSRLLSVDVPPETDIYLAYDVLEVGETSGVWKFEEAHVGHVTNP